MILDAAKPKHRYVVLDSLRGVCACMIVIFHLTSQGVIHNLPVIQNGYLFVDFFFVLSGFVIGSSYGERLKANLSIGRFMWFRLGRIYPLHFVVLMIFLAFEIFFALVAPTAANRPPFEGAMALPYLGYSLLFVQIFFGLDAVWNPPSWSIAAEMWTYLIFALLLRFAFRWTVPICIAIACAAPLIISQLTDRNLNVFHEGALLRCMFGFSLGIIGWRLADWVAQIRISQHGSDLIEVAVFIVVVLFVSIAGTSPLSLIAPFLFCVTLLVFSRQQGVVSRILMRPSFVLLGTLSYSIYMIHWFLLWRFINGLSLVEALTGFNLVHSVDGRNSVGGGALFGDMMSILFLGIVICASWFSYNFVELPGQRFVRRWPKDKPVAIPLSTVPGAP